MLQFFVITGTQVTFEKQQIYMLLTFLKDTLWVGIKLYVFTDQELPAARVSSTNIYSSYFFRYMVSFLEQMFVMVMNVLYCPFPGQLWVLISPSFTLKYCQSFGNCNVSVMYHYDHYLMSLDLDWFTLAPIHCTILAPSKKSEGGLVTKTR